jgi:hypothetical protein
MLDTRGKYHSYDHGTVAFSSDLNNKYRKYWGLNSRLCAYWAGDLLEPYPQPFFDLGIFQIRFSLFSSLGLDLVLDPPTYDSYIAGIIVMNHCTQLFC